MAIAARCESCQVEARATTPSELRQFLQQHRDPDLCAERSARALELSLWIVPQLPWSA
jgi:hypothetical protein